MAKTSMKVKQQRKPKFSTRAYTRCKICGRPHSVLRKYGICRVCFRELAYKGQITSELRIVGTARVATALGMGTLSNKACRWGFCIVSSPQENKKRRRNATFLSL